LMKKSSPKPERETRWIRIERCSNGYTVKYTEKQWEDLQIEEVGELDELDSAWYLYENTKVFICNDDLMDFLDDYFSDQPEPYRRTKASESAREEGVGGS
jgi:hypothetical protein